MNTKIEECCVMWASWFGEPVFW